MITDYSLNRTVTGSRFLKVFLMDFWYLERHCCHGEEDKPLKIYTKIKTLSLCSEATNSGQAGGHVASLGRNVPLNSHTRARFHCYDTILVAVVRKFMNNSNEASADPQQQTNRLLPHATAVHDLSAVRLLILAQSRNIS